MKKYVKIRKDAQDVADLIRDWPLGEYGYCVEILDQAATDQQRKSLHMYCGWLAKALNEAGLRVHMEFLGKAVDMEFTKDWVKENIWKPTMKTMFEIKSTTKLTRKQVSEVYDVLNRHFINAHDIYVPFPDKHEPPHEG